MAKALRRNGFHTTVLCPSRFSVGFVSSWANQRLLAPNAQHEAFGFLDNLKDVLKQYKYDVVIPLFDYSAEILSKNKALLSKWSNIAVNDYDIFMKARDKSQTMKICMENSIPCPQTVFPDESNIEECLEDLIFPVAVKPFCGDSAKGFSCVKSVDDLPDVFRETLEKYGPALVQEYISHTDLQYKAQLFTDNNSDTIAAVVFSKIRFYPIEGGGGQHL